VQNPRGEGATPVGSGKGGGVGCQTKSALRTPATIVRRRPRLAGLRYEGVLCLSYGQGGGTTFSQPVDAQARRGIARQGS